MTTKHPPPPAHLSASTKRWWKSVVAEFQLEDHHLHLLKLACEALDQAELARETLATLGMTYVDRFGSPRARPEVAIERDARIAYARILRELDLDVEPPSSGHRPPPLRSNRRNF
jgi:P27 family predicted phage terminase small subunit